MFILTCVSVSLSACARSALSGPLRYRCWLNRRSNSKTCAWVNAARDLFFRPDWTPSREASSDWWATPGDADNSGNKISSCRIIYNVHEHTSLLVMHSYLRIDIQSQSRRICGNNNVCTYYTNY